MFVKKHHRYLKLMLAKVTQVNLPALKETEGFPRRGIELYVAGKP